MLIFGLKKIIRICEIDYLYVYIKYIFLHLACRLLKNRKKHFDYNLIVSLIYFSNIHVT